MSNRQTLLVQQKFVSQMQCSELSDHSSTVISLEWTLAADDKYVTLLSALFMKCLLNFNKKLISKMISSLSWSDITGYSGSEILACICTCQTLTSGAQLIQRKSALLTEVQGEGLDPDIRFPLFTSSLEQPWRNHILYCCDSGPIFLQFPLHDAKFVSIDLFSSSCNQIFLTPHWSREEICDILFSKMGSC
jgi:hypothetical protein